MRDPPMGSGRGCAAGTMKQDILDEDMSVCETRLCARGATERAPRARRRAPRPGGDWSATVDPTGRGGPRAARGRAAHGAADERESSAEVGRGLRLLVQISRACGRVL